MDEAQKPQYTVQFIDHAHARTRSIVLSRSALYVLIGGVGALILAALFAAGFALRAGTMLHVHEVEAAQLREVNRLQQEQILQVAKKASALQQELLRLRTAEDGLRNALGAQGTAADTPVPENGEGTGGAPHEISVAQVREALDGITAGAAARRASLEALSKEAERTYAGLLFMDGAPQTVPSLWPTQGVISSPYGLRFGGTEFHQGIDIAAETGTPIVATADGVVTAAGWNGGGYGNMVDIDHGEGIATRYAHASSVVVTAGQRVRRGQIIAYVGSTGFSTGPHLHYEVRLGGHPVNPALYL